MSNRDEAKPTPNASSDEREGRERARKIEEHADEFAPFCERRGTLGIGLPNEGLGDRIRKQREDERRNR